MWLVYHLDVFGHIQCELRAPVSSEASPGPSDSWLHLAVQFSAHRRGAPPVRDDQVVAHRRDANVAGGVRAVHGAVAGHPGGQLVGDDQARCHRCHLHKRQRVG
jgi:hypothetical protein